MAALSCYRREDPARDEDQSEDAQIMIHRIADIIDHRPYDADDNDADDAGCPELHAGRFSFI